MTMDQVKEYAHKLSAEMCSRSGAEVLESKDPTIHLAVAAGMEILGFTRSFSKLEDDMFSEIILHRAQREPSDGLCDIVASRSAAFRSSDSSSRAISCPSDFSFLASRSSKSCEVHTENLPLRTEPSRYLIMRDCNDYDLEWAPGGILSLPDGMKNRLPPPFIVTQGAIFTPTVEPGDPCMLPFMVTICEEDFETYWTASQRCALYLASAVDLYAHLGIKDHPVWGLIMRGVRCVILMAQKLSINDVSDSITISSKFG